MLDAHPFSDSLLPGAFSHYTGMDVPRGHGEESTGWAKMGDSGLAGKLGNPRRLFLGHQRTGPEPPTEPAFQVNRLEK
jgi:hypothetical protein